MSESVICFDTNIIIWSVKKTASEHDEYRVNDAIYLLEKCQANKDKIILPSVAVAEVLSGTPFQFRYTLSQIFEEYFWVAPFDNQCAQHYSRLWDDRELRRRLKEKGASWEKIKFDCMIVATAVAKGAWKIYSTDNDIRLLTSNLSIEYCDLPPAPPSQPQLL